MSYLVKPHDMITGNYAPAIASFAGSEESAISDVKSRSRLSSFSNWDFRTIKKLKEKVVNSRFNREDE